jgi:hypothetical protein
LGNGGLKKPASKRRKLIIAAGKSVFKKKERSKLRGELTFHIVDAILGNGGKCFPIHLMDFTVYNILSQIAFPSTL